MGTEVGGCLQTAASEYCRAVLGPAEELLQAAAGSSIHLHPFPEVRASRPYPARGAALPPSQTQNCRASRVPGKFAPSKVQLNHPGLLPQPCHSESGCMRAWQRLCHAVSPRMCLC